MDNTKKGITSIGVVIFAILFYYNVIDIYVAVVILFVATIVAAFRVLNAHNAPFQGKKDKTVESLSTTYAVKTRSIEVNDENTSVSDTTEKKDKTVESLSTAYAVKTRSIEVIDENTSVSDTTGKKYETVESLSTAYAVKTRSIEVNNENKSVSDTTEKKDDTLKSIRTNYADQTRSIEVNNENTSVAVTTKQINENALHEKGPMEADQCKSREGVDKTSASDAKEKKDKTVEESLSTAYAVKTRSIEVNDENTSVSETTGKKDKTVESLSTTYAVKTRSIEVNDENTSVSDTTEKKDKTVESLSTAYAVKTRSIEVIDENTSVSDTTGKKYKTVESLSTAYAVKTRSIEVNNENKSVSDTTEKKDDTLKSIRTNYADQTRSIEVNNENTSVAVTTKQINENALHEKGPMEADQCKSREGVDKTSASDAKEKKDKTVEESLSTAYAVKTRSIEVNDENTSVSETTGKKDKTVESLSTTYAVKTRSIEVNDENTSVSDTTEKKDETLTCIRKAYADQTRSIEVNNENTSVAVTTKNTNGNTLETTGSAQAAQCRRKADKDDTVPSDLTNIKGETLETTGSAQAAECRHKADKDDTVPPDLTMNSTVHQKELQTGFGDYIATTIDKNLFDILKRRGLDISYWAKLLQDELGVTNSQQIEYLNENDFASLKKHVRYQWESKAIDDLSQHHNWIRGDSNAMLEYNKDPNSFEKTAKYEMQSTCSREKTRYKEKINIINKLGLQKFYPNKMKLWDVIKVKDLPATTDFSDTCWVFLKNIMMTNFNARDVLIEKHLEHLMESQTSIASDWNYDENAAEDVEATSNKDLQTINPLDLLVAIWECTSPILKQTLASKLFVCRLAIPFALTPNYDDLPIINVWPIRPIIIEQKVNKGSIQSSALKCPCHIVTFLRLGRLSISKSKLVNQILSDQYHDTFFNKDCSLGTSQRSISDGMIESAWDLSTSDSDTLSLYLNLRGDGLLYEGQVKLLSQISSVVVVMLDVSLLKDLQARDVLYRLHQCMDGIVLAVDAYSKSESTAKMICQQYMKDIPEYREKTKICKLAVSGMVCSSSHIKKEMIKGITTQTGLAVSLTKRLSEGRDTFFTTDENLTKFKQARQKAIQVSKLIPDGENVKERVVPLQGKLWLQFSETQKKTNQSTIYQPILEIERKKDYMKDQREKQLNAYKNQGTLMRTFVTTLLENEQSDEDCILFVAYLKQHLDDNSRNVLPEFLTQYQLAWQTLKTARGTNGSGIEMLQEKYKAAEYNLANASFGFEHLIRECGQMYEAIMECERETSAEDKVIAKGLGCMCAKLLLLGQPIEIMDGDAANVPLRWVEAVLKQLKHVIGDKKILTLSVLGIQSSGKSTLLNAMFGLQFAVSAGRCTRGVYAQLVPVESKNCDFDFILVFDTEGLRASELGHQKHDHDNKLATFVIGIGDITIVNIKGENTSEIKDILQIAVHAFLRLKIVNKRLNLKQGCVFVHQNVPATDANDKMMHGRQKLVEQLDEMTKEAAEQERITNITTFDQVIEFDSEKNVWYFSDLWVGDPPMAPTNPGYSNSAAAVKKAVMTQIVPSRKTFLTLTHTIIRIQDLWKGILRDDFVYGFRNSLEMKAYSSMEKRYQEISWAMHKDFFEFTVYKAKPALESSIDDESLNKNVAWITKTLNVDAEKNVTILIVNLESFVKNSELQDVMNQWIQTKTMRLRILKDSLIASTEAEIINLREEKKIQILQIKDKTKHELQINERARQLANDMKGERASRKQMSEKFEHMWSDWLQSFSATILKVRDECSVQEKIERLVWEQFSDLTSYLIPQLRDDEYVTSSSLVGSLSRQDFEIGKHLEIHRSYNPLKIVGLKKENNEKYLDHLMDITDTIFKKIQNKLRQKENQDTRFNTNYVTDILSILVEAIDDHNDKKSKTMRFNLLQPYKALLIHHVVQYITVAFTHQEDEYMKRHSLINQLVGYKETAWELFKNIVGKKTEDIISASFLKKALEKVVIGHVSELLPIDVQDAMLLKFSHQKYSIIRDVMIYLAEKGTFDECQSYIKDPATFVEEWLTKLMVTVVFEECRGDNEYTRYAAKHISSIIKAIEKSINMVKTSIDDSSTVSITTWIEEFTKQLTNLHALPISAHTFVHVKEKSVTDILIFVQAVLDQLVEIEENAVTHFRKTKAETVKWKHNPLSKIMKELWGCKATCPFCYEPCKSTDKDHVELGIFHQCLQHRIKGLSDRYWKSSGNLSLNFCNIDVQRDLVSFRSDKSEEWTKYKDYKKEHPDWDIEPTPDTSKYWMWLLCRYQSNFEEKYEKKFDTIPPNWFTITKEEALKSLKT